MLEASQLHLGMLLGLAQGVDSKSSVPEQAGRLMTTAMAFAAGYGIEKDQQCRQGEGGGGVGGTEEEGSELTRPALLAEGPMSWHRAP